jgi:hypothetical protein
MPLEEPKTLNVNKVSPMSLDRSVTYVPGLDPYGAATIGSGQPTVTQKSSIEPQTPVRSMEHGKKSPV